MKKPQSSRVINLMSRDAMRKKNNFIKKMQRKKNLVRVG
jgi:hypothetical protein